MNKMFVVLDKKEINEEEQSIVAWGSKPVIDRDKELIKGEAWDLKEFRKNPVLMLSHDYRQPPIGKVLWAKKNKEGLRFKAQFAKTQIAEEVFQLYKDDIMRAFSVGFIPKKWVDADSEKGNGDNPRRVYTNVELLEISCVSIPSCPDALMEAHDSGKIKTKELNDILEVIKTEEKAKKYKCSCVKCDYEMESDKHCKDLKCDECGGQMRRVERPGPGQEGKTEEEEYGIEGVSIESKEAEEFHNKLTKLENEEENTCKEVTTKPEETDDFIRIPVRDCKVTATITISAKEGITALYCGKIKKIRTYIFNKKAPYNWTMKKAQAWVKEHGKSVDAAVEAFATDLPEEDINNVTDFIESYLEKEAEKELKEGYEKYDKIADENWAKFAEEVQPQLIEKIETLSDEIKEIKEGRVLSGKNLKLVKDCKEQVDKVSELLGKLIVASEPPKEESVLPLIEESKSEDNNINSLTKDDVPVIVEEVLNGLSEAMSGQHKEIRKIFDKSRGKVS